MKKSMIVKQCQTYLKGTTLKLWKQYLHENEITEAELLRDLVREFVKKKYNLSDGINRLKV